MNIIRRKKFQGFVISFMVMLIKIMLIKTVPNIYYTVFPRLLRHLYPLLIAYSKYLHFIKCTLEMLEILSGDIM